MSLYFKSSTGEEFDAGGREGWGKLYDLAKSYGWEPAGTTMEDSTDWDGSYFSNDYQLISPEDGKNLAEAIDRAVEDLKSNTRLKLWSSFTPEHLRTAASFFRKGGITIC